MYSIRYSCQILMKLELSRQSLKKNIQISKFMKISPVGAELLHAEGRTDGRTDMTKLRVAFRNFANASKKGDLMLQKPSTQLDTLMRIVIYLYKQY
jgi:hypothetical protein